jgi:putative PIG3 family NAD(P)H quinone oxidoreductase
VKAIHVRGEALEWAEAEAPAMLPGHVRLRVRATAVNRADLHQRAGHYPPPPGKSHILGLEAAGEVMEAHDASGVRVGDRVCALLAGGGYAELVAVPAGQLMPVPDGIDLITAGSIPEVACTVWSNLFMIAGLQPGERLLVHGGSGGIGTFAIQLASAMSAKVFTTAGTAEKLAACADLGADVTINYRDEDFVEVLRESGGADVILDNMGAKYLGRNVEALASEGRLVVIGLQGGTKGELDLGTLLRKRGAVIATSLRSRPAEEKAVIAASVVEHVWPLVADGQVRPIVHTTMPLDQVADAHRLMEDSSHIGKIVLTP